MQLSIIIVHWNTPEELRQNLKSLCQTHHEIIVVDNNSEKRPIWIHKEFSKVIVIQNKINRGYSFACNQGSLIAKGDWLLFLNPDALITPNQIEELYSYATKNKYDAVSPHTAIEYHQPVPSTLSLYATFSPLRKFLPLKLFKKKTLFGGCLLIKKEVLWNIGGWDERFFIWFEDSDLTKRLYNADYTVGWLKMDVKHKGSSSFVGLDKQTKRDIFFNSMEIYAKKHLSTVGQLVLHVLKIRYTKTNLIPMITCTASIVVPNMKLPLLATFLKENLQYISTDTELIVVSSAIPFSLLWEYRRENPDIRFIIIAKNRGFATTVNIGLRAATGEWIGTFNDDTRLNKETVHIMITNASENSGSINPIVYNNHDIVESAGIVVEKKGKAYPVTDAVKITTQTQATNGAAVFYNKKALQKVGLFDEKFGSYLEDIDLSLRLSKAGYKNIVTPATILHAKHATSSSMGVKKQWLDFKNWILVILKNWSWNDLVANIPQILVERLRNISGIIKTVTKKNENLL